VTLALALSVRFLIQVSGSWEEQNVFSRKNEKNGSAFSATNLYSDVVRIPAPGES
jgi:hypothetical protein